MLVLGILLTAAGVVAIGFGIPISDIALANTLILAGTTAMVGGFVVVGLAATVAELSRLADALRTPRPAASTQRSAEQVQPAAPEPSARVEQPVTPPVGDAAALNVSASAIERLRSSIPRPDRVVPDAVPLSPNGSQAATQPEPQLPAHPQPAEVAADGAREPRLDFLLRARPRAPQQASFDAVWPKRPGQEGDGQPVLEERPVVAAAAVQVAEPEPLSQPVEPAPQPDEIAPPPVEAPRPVAVLKSGVVDGMAYTLYADGSIEAQLPQGMVRFGSIAELRAHIESNA
ncbi:MAG: hypothetical protein ACRECO_15900 [Xanthobacteraceae bacterium]